MLQTHFWLCDVCFISFYRCYPTTLVRFISYDHIHDHPLSSHWLLSSSSSLPPPLQLYAINRFLFFILFRQFNQIISPFRLLLLLDVHLLTFLLQRKNIFWFWIHAHRRLDQTNELWSINIPFFARRLCPGLVMSKKTYFSIRICCYLFWMFRISK